MPSPLKQAIALKTISVLYRRHHKDWPLRLVETHPGGGMYDCIGLTVGRFEKFLCNFNLAGSSLVLEEMRPPTRPPYDPKDWESDGDYPTLYMEKAEYKSGPWGSEDFVNLLEARLGLEVGRKPAPATASSVSIGVLAQLAERFSLSSNPPDFRSGYSGDVRKWVADFPEIQAKCDASRDGVDQALVAGRLWRITDSVPKAEESTETRAPVVDLATGRVSVQGEYQGSLWTRYQEGEGVRKLAWWVETLWKGE